MKYLQRYGHHILLGAILALALGLRLWGVGFGLPYVGFQPDEWYISDVGLTLLRDGFTLSKLSIGTLHAYIQAGIGWLVFRLVEVDPIQVPTYGEILAAEGIGGAAIVGVPHPLPAYYLWGRIAVAVMGAITVWLTYLIGREIESAEVGLMGALFLAASPLHAEYSHYLIRTMPGLMFLLLTFYVILMAYQRERWWFYGAGSVLAAVAILTKQNNLVILAPLGLALGLSLWRAARHRSLRAALQAGGAGVLAVGIGSLTLALALGYRDLADLYSGVFARIWRGSVYDYHLFGYAGNASLLWVLNYFLRDPWRFVFLLALPGIGPAAVKLRDKGWLLLSIPLPYLIPMNFFTMRFVHWLIPMIPFLGILAGVFLAWGGRWAGQRLSRWPIPWHRLVAIGALVITLTSLKLIVLQDYWLGQKDVRVIASEWLQANISRETKVVTEGYGPYLPSRTHQVEYVASVVQKNMETYQAEGVDYLVVNELLYRLTQAEAANPAGDPVAKEYMARYQVMSEELSLVQEFVGPTMLYPGQWVRVYGVQKER